MVTRFVVIASLVGSSLAVTATAQDLDFGAWCSDVAHFDANRCAEARPEDKQAYDRYVSKIGLFYDELYRRDEARRLEMERINRMGDVTPDQTRDPFNN